MLLKIEEFKHKLIIVFIAFLLICAVILLHYKQRRQYKDTIARYVPNNVNFYIHLNGDRISGKWKDFVYANFGNLSKFSESAVFLLEKSQCPFFLIKDFKNQKTLPNNKFVYKIVDKDVVLLTCDKKNLLLFENYKGNFAQRIKLANFSKNFNDSFIQGYLKSFGFIDKNFQVFSKFFPFKNINNSDYWFFWKKDNDRLLFTLGNGNLSSIYYTNYKDFRDVDTSLVFSGKEINKILGKDSIVNWQILFPTFYQKILEFKDFVDVKYALNERYWENWINLLSSGVVLKLNSSNFLDFFKLFEKNSFKFILVLVSNQKNQDELFKLLAKLGNHLGQRLVDKRLIDKTLVKEILPTKEKIKIKDFYVNNKIFKKLFLPNIREPLFFYTKGKYLYLANNFDFLQENISLCQKNDDCVSKKSFFSLNLGKSYHNKNFFHSLDLFIEDKMFKIWLQ